MKNMEVRNVGRKNFLPILSINPNQSKEQNHM